MSYTKRTRTAIGLAIAATMITATACGGDDGKGDSAGASDKSASQDKAGADQQPPAPDLKGIPDVVAEVNGQEVTKDEFVPPYKAQFQQAASQAQMGGQKPDEDALKKQTIDSLVNTELLVQEADGRGFKATDKDVDDELAALAKENQLASADALLAALKKQGTSEDAARAQVKAQVVVEQLIADETGPVKPTEKELRAIYNKAKQQQKQAGEQSGQQPIPPYAKVKAQLVEQAKSEAQGKVAQGLVDKLRKGADIKINL